jgi:hypothetical protein
MITWSRWVKRVICGVTKTRRLVEEAVERLESGIGSWIKRVWPDFKFNVAEALVFKV